MPTLGNTPRPAYVYDTETDTWVPVGVGAHTHSDIPNTLVDAKGDLITATADNVPARLAKGADGTILVSDSTTSTGLAWQPYASQNIAGKNVLINGLFDFWQRSTDVTSSTVSGTFYAAADRWQTWNGVAVSTRYQRITDADPGVSRSSYRIQRVSGSTTATNYQIVQSIETSTSKLLVGKTMTLSLRVKKGANFSPTSGQFSARVQYNNNTDGNPINQAVTTAFTGSFSPTTSFATYSVTGTIPSSGVSTVMVNIIWEPTGTAGADDWLEISAVQLEIGSIATPFSRAAGTYQGELAACQRYYYRTSYDSTYGAFGSGIAYSTTAIRTLIIPPVPMRIAPSSVEYGGTNPFWCWDGVNNAFSATAPTLQSGYYGTRNVIGIDMTGFSGLTQFRYYIVGHGGSGNSNQYIGFNAEL
jgi:hypothetical protein